MGINYSNHLESTGGPEHKHTDDWRRPVIRVLVDGCPGGTPALLESPLRLQLGMTGGQMGAQIAGVEHERSEQIGPAEAASAAHSPLCTECACTHAGADQRTEVSRHTYAHLGKPISDIVVALMVTEVQRLSKILSGALSGIEVHNGN